VLDDHGVGTILDYSAEGKEIESDFEKTAEEICRTVTTSHENQHIPFCVFKVTGVARLGLLEKVNAQLELDEQEEKEFEAVRSRVNRICESAFKAGTPLFIDAEESWIQDALDAIVEEMMAKYNQEKAVVYNTVQLYRTDRLEYLRKSINQARETGYFIGQKLVRGAYMEKERDRAREQGYPSPIQPDQHACNVDFDKALELCIENIDVLSLCAGTHNEESSHHLTELMTKAGVAKEDPRVFFAQLFGMSDHISFNLASAGYNVAKYVPYGPVREVVPYLIRRAEENTSIKGQTGRELKLIQTELKRRKMA
jgi:proline dehydrogenase